MSNNGFHISKENAIHIENSENIGAIINVDDDIDRTGFI